MTIMPMSCHNPNDTFNHRTEDITAVTGSSTPNNAVVCGLIYLTLSKYIQKQTSFQK